MQFVARNATGGMVPSKQGDRGSQCFAHEAGIHQDGILKDRRTYEIMAAEDVGVPTQPLVLGKHSGRHAVQKRLSDNRSATALPSVSA
jgi:2-isopropylmalate synthase